MIARRKPIGLYLLSTLVVVGGGVLAYELGRFNGGYSFLDQRRERDELTAQIGERDQTIEELKRRLAVLETSQEIDRETYSQVEANLNELQARIQSQEEELAFYRGIISPEEGAAGVRVQSFELRPADRENAYVLHLVLVQAITHDRRVSGTVHFEFAGSLDGEPTALALDTLVSAGSDGDLAYSFRYFQDLQREFVLPAGFEPDEVQMQIRPREPSGQPIGQTFAWSAVTG
jgi:hypothetical protein